MNQYGKIWLKSNMKAVGVSYKTKFVTEFREAMEAVIEKANKD